MSRFEAGQIDVLVATTVVEVGVDVPNATTMVILDAESFGMSTLHQLRGRIGRGVRPPTSAYLSLACRRVTPPWNACARSPSTATGWNWLA